MAHDGPTRHDFTVCDISEYGFCQTLGCERGKSTREGDCDLGDKESFEKSRLQDAGKLERHPRPSSRLGVDCLFANSGPIDRGTSGLPEISVGKKFSFVQRKMTGGELIGFQCALGAYPPPKTEMV